MTTQHGDAVAICQAGSDKDRREQHDSKGREIPLSEPHHSGGGSRGRTSMDEPVDHLTDTLAVHWHINNAVTIRIGTGGVGQSVTLSSGEAHMVAECIEQRRVAQHTSQEARDGQDEVRQ